jgi:hypothetical protein
MGVPVQAWVVAAGLYDLAFASFHALFPVIFRWSESLARLDAVNRGILHTLNVMLSLVFLAAGLAFTLLADLVAADRLGRGLLLASAGFWLVRGALQGPMFGLTHPWSKALLPIFALGVILHAVPAWP